MVIIMQILPKVLLVEDDRSIASALSQALQSSYDVEVSGTGQLAIYKTDTANYDIVLLDLDLPDMAGLSVCQLLREGGLQTPILVLTADSRTLTKINLLDAGANDYLTKPFSLGELKARLRALTRNGRQPLKPAGKLAISGLELDRKTHEVKRDGVVINLRRKEFAMLECLMEHAGSVVTRRALTRYAWHGAEDLWTNTVDVHIKHLRDKVDRPFGTPLIRTVHGIGYRLEVIQSTSKIEE
jgi:two-component system OmpR family response regulator